MWFLSRSSHLLISLIIGVLTAEWRRGAQDKLMKGGGIASDRDSAATPTNRNNVAYNVTHQERSLLPELTRTDRQLIELETDGDPGREGYRPRHRTQLQHHHETRIGRSQLERRDTRRRGGHHNKQRDTRNEQTQLEHHDGGHKNVDKRPDRDDAKRPPSSPVHKIPNDPVNEIPSSPAESKLPSDSAVKKPRDTLVHDNSDSPATSPGNKPPDNPVNEAAPSKPASNALRNPDNNKIPSHPVSKFPTYERSTSPVNERLYNKAVPDPTFTTTTTNNNNNSVFLQDPLPAPLPPASKPGHPSHPMVSRSLPSRRSSSIATREKKLGQLQRKMVDLKAQLVSHTTSAEALARQLKNLTDTKLRLEIQLKALKKKQLKLEEAAAAPAVSSPRMPWINVSVQSRRRGYVAFHSLISFQMKTYKLKEVVKFDQILTNEGMGYNGSTGIFTAPVSGLYGTHAYVNLNYRPRVNHDRLHFYAASLMLDNPVRYVARARTRWVGTMLMQGPCSAVLTMKRGEKLWVQNDGHTAKFWEGYSTFSGVLIRADPDLPRT